jgi:hypothetical protein
MEEIADLAEIDAAEHQLELAEQELSAAIGALRAVPRAEKTVTTHLIEDALDKVKASRTALQALRIPEPPSGNVC